MKLKRLFYAVLAFIMAGYNLGGILPVMAVEGDAPIIQNPEPVEIKKNGEGTGIILSKIAEPVEGYVNRYKITLRVESPKTEKTSDTVLVIDRSNSMNGTKITNARAAADSLAKELLPEGNTLNRIAIVSYGTDVQDVSNGFSNSYQTIHNAIYSIADNGGGTFTQAGLRKARQILEGVTTPADYQTIVLLSDGAPSYSYGIKNFSASNDLVYASSTSGDIYQFKVMASANKFDYDTKVGDGSKYTYQSEGAEMWDEAGTARINGWNQYYYYNHGNSARAEANFYKATGNTLYTIALNAGTWGNGVLHDMASTGKDKTATEENLKQIFDEIAGEISSLIKTAQVEDVMGDGVVVSTATGVTMGENNGSFTWNLEAKDFKLTADGSKFYAEKSYIVDFTEDLPVEDDDVDKYFALNKEAKITYNNGEGEGYFPTPSARPFKVNVEKILKQLKNGEESSLPDGREFRFQISGVDKTFSVKSGEPHIIPVTVPIEIGTEYTVTEVAWVPENSNVEFANYKVEYPNGNKFKIVADQANQDVHIVIKNTYEVTDITASKEWNDDSDRDALRNGYKDKLYVALKDGNKYVAYKTVSMDDNSSYTFENLPKNRNNSAINYTVVEAKNCSTAKDGTITCTDFSHDDNYTATVSDNKITNAHTPATTSVLIKKSWATTATTLPKSITVNLKGGDVDENITITEDDKVEGECTEWCKKIDGLYKYNKGEEIQYTVKETNIFGTSADGFIEYGTDETASGQKSVNGKWDAKEDSNSGTWTITNTWTPANSLFNGSTDFSIKKIDKNGNPLSGVKFTVNGEEKITDENGKITIEIPANLLVREETKNYEIIETVAKDGYDLDGDAANLQVVISSALASVTSSGSLFTNTYNKSFTFTASGNKNYTWNKEERMFILKNNRSTAKTLTIEKTFSGVSAEALKKSDLSFTVTGPEDFTKKVIAFSEFNVSGNKGTFVLQNVPTGDYTVEEKGGTFDGLFTMTTTGGKQTKTLSKNSDVKFTIDNTYTAVTGVSYEVEKIWDDDDNRDNLRPTKLSVDLMANGSKVDTKELTGDSWSYKWENLPKANENAEPLTYSVVEKLVGTDYTLTNTKTETGKTTFTNTHTPAKTSVLIKKTWVGEKTIPDSITVNLTGGGVNQNITIKSTDKVEGECTEWCKKIDGLNKYNQGEEIEYTVRETNIFGTSADGFIEYGTDETEDGKKAVNGKWDAHAEKNTGDWTITNTWTPATSLYNGSTDFSIKKVDKNGNPLSGVKFTVNGEEFTTGEDGKILVEIPTNQLVSSETKNYEIIETVAKDGYDLDGDKANLEVVIESGLVSVNETTLTNTYSKTFTFTASGNKHYVWNKEERMFILENKRSEPKSLTIEKTFSGIDENVLKESDLVFTVSGPDDFETKNIPFSDFTIGNGKGTYVLKNVPTGDYTVEEKGGEFKESFTLTTTGDNGATKALAKDKAVKFTINNTYAAIADVEYEVAKIWDDDDDRDGLRPTKLSVDLMANGSKVDTKELTGDSWSYKWENLPRVNEKNETLTYSVVEKVTGDYEQTKVETEDGKTTFTNKHTPALINEEDDDPDNDGKITVMKVWEDGDDLLGNRPTVIMVKLLANGEELQTVPVAKNSEGVWTHTFTGLYKNANGEEIEYTIEEGDLDGYLAEISGNLTDGFEIINTSTDPCSFGGCGKGENPGTPDTGRMTADKSAGAVNTSIAGTAFGATVLLFLIALFKKNKKEA